jgi:hypothetical protein
MRICNVATIYFNSLTVLCLALKSLIQIKTNNWYLSFTENAKNCLTWGTLKRHISIGVLVVYIDTGSTVPNIPSKSRGLADENKKFLTEWKWFETTVLSDVGKFSVEIIQYLRQILFCFILNIWEKVIYFSNYIMATTNQKL